MNDMFSNNTLSPSASTRKGKLNVVNLQSTSAGFVSGDKNMPRGVPSGFHIVGEAMNTLMSYPEEKCMFGEAKYKQLYDELVSNETEWLEVSIYVVSVLAL